MKPPVLKRPFSRKKTRAHPKKQAPKSKMIVLLKRAVIERDPFIFLLRKNVSAKKLKSLGITARELLEFGFQRAHLMYLGFSELEIGEAKMAQKKIP